VTRPDPPPTSPWPMGGVIAGGQVPMLGEVSPAHHDVLWLDARPECTRHGLEVLRQPLEKSVL
jgi:predicted ATPase with chaperone activity